MGSIGLFGAISDSARSKEDIISDLSDSFFLEQDSPGLFEIREDLFRKAEDRLNKINEKIKTLNIAKDADLDLYDCLVAEGSSIREYLSDIKELRLRKIVDIAYNISFDLEDHFKEKDCALTVELGVFEELRDYFLKIKNGWNIMSAREEEK